jgi:hypothetical protein
MSAATAPNGRARGPRVPLVTPLPQPQPAPEPLAALATPNLDAAVLRVQAKVAPIVRNAKGQIQNRMYTYATLTAVTDEVLPLLVEEQLLWKVYPTVLVNGAPGVRYRMTHVPSSEFEEDTMPLLVDQTMQALGSGITYGRRQALTAYLNLTIDEDDDGRGANTPVSAPVDRYAEAEAAHHAAPQPVAAPAKPTERPANAKERGMLEARARAAGLSAGEFANVLLVAGDAPPRVWRTEEHAEQTLKRLLDRLPAKLVTAVKDGIGEGS